MIPSRIIQIQQSIQKASLHGVLFSSPYSIRFFSGFWSSNALFLITSKESFFFTDPRYLGGAKEFFLQTDTQVRDFLKEEEWKSFFEKLNTQKLGIEMNTLPVSKFLEWKKSFKIQLQDFSFEASILRSQKTKEEIAAGEKASFIADLALKEVLPILQPGISEKEFSWKLEKAGRNLGADKVSFDAVVAFGEHSAVPHYHVTNRTLKMNEPILIDWGFVADDFCSDCTRCFYMGNPDGEWLEMYEKVSSAQKLGINCIASGQNICEAQEEAEKKLKEKIPHSFGHGVGIEAHEYPRISQKTKGKFSENMIVTAEPGIYREGKFGIRIEDMGTVTKNGFQSLTKFPKRLEFAVLKKLD